MTAALPFLAPVAEVAGRVAPAPAAAEASSFTLRDRLALETWRLAADRHGYRRVEIGTAPGDGAGETMFALIYPPDTPWASWGVSCGLGALVTWRCGTGETVGRFATMAEALAAIPPAGV